MARTPQDPSIRFWSKVAKAGPDDCWPWQGKTSHFGHGRFRLGGRDSPFVQVHRYAYECTVGPIPEGLVLRHRCDNAPCCNPAHLMPGTHQDNMDDMAQRGRRRAAQRDEHPRTKLTTRDVAAICRSSLPNVVLARRFGVAKSTITYAKQRAAAAASSASMGRA